MRDLSVYLSGPFSTPEQCRVIKKLEAELSGLGLRVWSPSRDGIQVPPGTLKFQIDRAFGDNYHYIGACDVVVAVLDGWDAGVLWECGAAYESGKAVIGYMSKASQFPTPLLSRAFRGVAGDLSQLARKFEDLHR